MVMHVLYAMYFVYGMFVLYAMYVNVRSCLLMFADAR